jgi:hypothetical protein
LHVQEGSTPGAAFLFKRGSVRNGSAVFQLSDSPDSRNARAARQRGVAGTAFSWGNSAPAAKRRPDLVKNRSSRTCRTRAAIAEARSP